MIKRSDAQEKKLRDALRLNLGKRKGQTRAWDGSKEIAAEIPSFWTETENGTRLYVRLSPGAATAKIGGIYHGEHGRIWVKASVTSPPENGAANDDLIDLISDKIGLSKSCIAIETGETSRLKTLELPILRGDQKTILTSWEN